MKHYDVELSNGTRSKIEASSYEISEGVLIFYKFIEAACMQDFPIRFFFHGQWKTVNESV